MKDRRLIRAGVIVALVVAVFAVVRSVPAPAIAPAPPLTSPPGQCDTFAATNGPKSGNGSWKRPYPTVARLVGSLRRGQTGCLRAGVYEVDADRGDYGLVFKTREVTLRSYPGERARVKAQIEVPRGADGVRLLGLDIEGTGGLPSIKAWASDFVLEDSDVTNAWRGASCVQLGSEAGGARRPVIRRNRFHQCGAPEDGKFDHAIYAGHVTEGLITDNVFWGVMGYTIQLYPDAQRTVVSHNVVDGGSPSERGGIVFGGNDNSASSNNVVEHNVVTYAATANITSSWENDVGTGNVARSNCLFGGEDGDVGSNDGFSEENNLSADPLFVDRAAHDYRLKGGSPCLSVVGYDTAAKLAGDG